jgi:3'(2'), 5'-bisphosphate nucleotidase
MSLERERELAVELARRAGSLVLEVYGSDVEVQWKAGSDPVTLADKRANAFLVEALRARLPGDGVVAEESADHGDALRCSRCWFVDPLDGTKEFLARNGEFAVMLGLAVEGRAQLGVVYQPVLDKLYAGVVGEGAILEERGATRALGVSGVSEPAQLSLVVSRSHRSQSTDEVVRRLGITRERPSGSVGLKVGLIAEQVADVYVHLSGRSSLWDACAPEAILRAAGGRFTDLQGAELDYRRTDMQNHGGILACNAAAYPAVLAVVRDVVREQGVK